jgi:hypothetical protein
MESIQQQSKKDRLPFEIRAATALGISITADTLDYVGAPVLDIPVLGDIPNALVMLMLYRLTGSKMSTAINAAKFIPIVGDFIPTYTISTAIWTLKELRRRKKVEKRIMS